MDKQRLEEIKQELSEHELLVVPREPTEAQLDAAVEYANNEWPGLEFFQSDAAAIYKAMLQASEQEGE